MAIVGLSREVSVASAQRAVQNTYVTLVATLALGEGSGRWVRAGTSRDGPQPSRPPDPAALAAEALAASDPEVIVLVGGIDGGATTALYELADLVAAIVAVGDDAQRPTVVFAGNREARPGIAQRIGQIATLRVVDNVHPTLEREAIGPLQRELEALYIERKLAGLPGVAALNRWSKVPVLPTAYAFENVVRYLSRRYGLAVMGIDIGATATIAVTARGNAVSRIVRTDLGLGKTLTNLVEQAGTDTLLGWLPNEMNADDLCARLLNHSLHPAMLPSTPEHARLLQVAARQAIAMTVHQGGLSTSGTDLIVLAGGPFEQNTSHGALALLALDALEPTGVFTLAVDNLGLAPAFGGLAPMNAQAAANVVERDGFLTLGTVIAPISANREGQLDMRVKVVPAGGGPIELDVLHGSLEIVPLAHGQKASLEVRPALGVVLGAAGRGVFKAEVEGGAAGLIIDARGRPIAFPTNPAKRREKIQQWLWDVGG